MATKGTVHPSNLKLAAGEHSVLDRLDFFFGDPARSGAIGEFFQKEAAGFSGFADTNSPEGLAAYALFKQYSGLVDGLLTAFCDEDNLDLETVATECIAEFNRLEGAPSAFICLPYVIAALEMDAFVDLAFEMRDVNEYAEEEGEEAPEEGDAPAAAE